MGNSVIRFYEPEGENGYLSNWYLSDFQYAGRKYHSMEQYMMFQKALTFGDLEIADRIMASQSLPEIKKLGRSVAHYNDVLWKTIRVQIMRRGIRAKFQQNPELFWRNARPVISYGESVWISMIREATIRRSGKAGTFSAAR